jgi:2-polyprenyl-3-methyl-5-hydroxy-6-metoxy-1,4-benzoquinol methylase
MFDWTKITSDPACPKMGKKWREHYDEKIVRFNLFAIKPRDEMVMDLCFQNKPETKLLDVGFAEHNLDYAKSKNWFHGMLRRFEQHKIFGLDLNREAVDAISVYSGFNNLIVGDATDTSLIIDNGNFDAVHAGDVIEHVGNISDFLKFCSNNLKPFGRVVISTPNPCAQVAMDTFRRIGLQANMEHTCWVTPSNMNELCRRHGFNFEESHYIMHKKRSIKNRLRERIIFRKKDLYFGEFIYVITKNS